jgi:hypothetical protein
MGLPADEVTNWPSLVYIVKGPTAARPQLLYTLPILTHPKRIVGGYFLMSGSNAPIVRRTWGLLETRVRTATGATPEEKASAYGPHFDYEEFMQTNSKARGFVISAAIFGTVVLMLFAPVR